MIEIITEEVKMPPLDKRRFQKSPIDLNGRKWLVTDTHEATPIYKGAFENASLICHNSNKKFYRDNPVKTKT